jgi:hypothetical protein
MVAIRLALRAATQGLLSHFAKGVLGPQLNTGVCRMALGLSRFPPHMISKVDTKPFHQSRCAIMRDTYQEEHRLEGVRERAVMF